MNKPTIYLDMDGVVANFVRGYNEAFNRNANKDDPFTVEQFCLQVPHFFRMLPMNDHGFELFNYLKNDYKIIFLTTPMKSMKFCKRDKIDWIRENIGDYDVRFPDNKSLYVIDEQSVLIDDMDYNLDAWKGVGGTAIKFPQSIEKILNIIEGVFNPDTKKIDKQIKNLKVNTSPTEKQKLTGIYKKGNIDLKGLKIKIENPKGSIRWGRDSMGQKWLQRMNHHYGYITGTEGADFDPVDCFVGPHPNKSVAFVVNQGEEGMFDEHKIMLGFESIEDAEAAYMSNYQKGWNGLMSIVQTNTKRLRDWLKNGNKNEPYK